MLSEPSEPNQLGCALCLCSILPAAGPLPEPLAQRISAPLVKSLGHPMAGAHPALLEAASLLVRVNPAPSRSHAGATAPG